MFMLCYMVIGNMENVLLWEKCEIELIQAQKGQSKGGKSYFMLLTLIVDSAVKCKAFSVFTVYAAKLIIICCFLNTNNMFVTDVYTVVRI